MCVFLPDFERKPFCAPHVPHHRIDFSPRSRPSDSQVSQCRHSPFIATSTAWKTGTSRFTALTSDLHGQRRDNQYKALERAHGGGEHRWLSWGVYWRLLHLLSPVEAAMRAGRRVRGGRAAPSPKSGCVRRPVWCPLAVHRLPLTFHGLIGVASEAKALVQLCQIVQPVAPGQTWILDPGPRVGCIQRTNCVALPTRLYLLL